MAFLIFSLWAMIGGLLMLVSTYGVATYLEGRGLKINYSNLRSEF